MEDEILELAMALGHVDAGERENLRLLCQAAQAEWTARLKEGVRAEDCAPALRVAAAWTALEMLEESGGVEKFSAGDLSVETRGERGRLRRQGEQVMGPYVGDDRFSFRGTQG